MAAWALPAMAFGSSVMGGIGQMEAAEAQERSAAAQLAENRRIYEDMARRWAPYEEFGGTMLSRLSQAMADPSSVDVSTMPGYQSGLDAVQASQAARGGRFTGGAMKELSDYGQSRYDQYLDRLANMAGFGTGAISGTGTAGAQFQSASAAPYSTIGQARGMGAAAPYQMGGNILSNMAFSGMMNQGGGYGAGTFTDYGGGGFGPTVPQQYSVPSNVWG